MMDRLVEIAVELRGAVDGGAHFEYIAMLVEEYEQMREGTDAPDWREMEEWTV